jgi:predicted adenylyl cyclase CyaB
VSDGHPEPAAQPGHGVSALDAEQTAAFAAFRRPVGDDDRALLKDAHAMRLLWDAQAGAEATLALAAACTPAARNASIWLNPPDDTPTRVRVRRYGEVMSVGDSARRNVELKATDPDPGSSLQVCRDLGAADHGVIQQRDTYFNVERGGLKLREELPGRPHLIQFERADQSEQRQSNYRIVEVDDGVTLRAALEAALGVRGVVEKRRHLFLWQQVRIHLDEVDGLGCFIELEAVAPAQSDLSHEHRLITQLRDAFAITDDRLRATGYASQLRI